jgi:hypothetical protein
MYLQAFQKLVSGNGQKVDCLWDEFNQITTKLACGFRIRRFSIHPYIQQVLIAQETLIL